MLTTTNDQPKTRAFGRHTVCDAHRQADGNGANAATGRPPSAGFLRRELLPAAHFRNDTACVGIYRL